MLEAILSAAAELPEVGYADGSAVITEGEEQRRLLVLVSGSV